MTAANDDRSYASEPLRRTARSLLAALEHLRGGLVAPASPQGPLLDLGSPGAVAAAWGLSQLGEATYLHTDLRACREARLLTEGDSGNLQVLHSDRLPDGPFAIAALDGTAFDPGFARELAARAAQSLHPEGVFLTIPPAQEPLGRWRAHLAESFREVKVQAEAPAASDPRMVIARRPVHGAAADGSIAVGAASVFGETSQWAVDFAGRRFSFQSAPGVFSPRSLDAGTRVMLEALLESVAKSTPELLSSAKVLDLGAGVGAVGVILASLWGCHVTATDVNARALRLTAENAGQNGLAERIRVVASDAFSDLTGATFDLIVSHPPYHSDYAVAKRFIEGAFGHLRSGGSLWLVVKRGVWYENRLRAVFGGCRVTHREGYVVLTAERREAGASPGRTGKDRPSGGAAPGATRKHRQREEQAARRRARR